MHQISIFTFLGAMIVIGFGLIGLISTISCLWKDFRENKDMFSLVTEFML